MVARKVHLELRVAVAAVLETKGFELVVTEGERLVAQGQVAPGVAWCVLSSVNANESARTKVRVVAEVVRPGDVAAERDAYVEPDVAVACPCLGPARSLADVLVAEICRRGERAHAVSFRLRVNQRALDKDTQCSSE